MDAPMISSSHGFKDANRFIDHSSNGSLSLRREHPEGGSMANDRRGEISRRDFFRGSLALAAGLSSLPTAHSDAATTSLEVGQALTATRPLEPMRLPPAISQR